jgi:branched-chain amino acid transport system substrate-binding protein
MRDTDQSSREPSKGRRSFHPARLTAASMIALALAACASQPSPGPIQPAPPATPQGAPQPLANVPPPKAVRPGVTPQFMANRPLTRIGLLLPFASVASEAQSLYEAAELALFEAKDPNVMLMPRDSGGDAATSQGMTANLVRDGADVIVGPLLKEGVQGAASATASANPPVPVIGFSSDNTIAAPGVYLLSFPFEDEVARIVSYAALQNLKRIALLAPDSEYGHRVDAAVRAEGAKVGVSVVVAQFYQRSEREAGAAAQLIVPQARAWDAQAMMIADAGAPLRSIGPALLTAGLDLQRVRLLGVGWAGSDAYREPTLASAWYAGPDPAVRAGFEQRYRAAYGRAPTRLASLAYDAVAMAEALTRDVGYTGLSTLQRPDGFNGADGLYRFRQNGTVERALAILEVRGTGPVVIDAPPKFPGSGS